MSCAVEWTLRRASSRDEPFLWTLHGSTMREYITHTWGWDEGWQRRDFRERLERYDVSIIETGAVPVGAVWLERSESSVFIADFQIAPETQNRGIGTGVLSKIIVDAANARSSVSLAVLECNPKARRLYERHGFVVAATHPPFIYMQRNAGALFT
jgi:ribosomal protein S18 acetylase RimI-like enzyme